MVVLRLLCPSIAICVASSDEDQRRISNDCSRHTEYGEPELNSALGKIYLTFGKGGDVVIKVGGFLYCPVYVERGEERLKLDQMVIEEPDSLQKSCCVYYQLSKQTITPTL